VPPRTVWGSQRQNEQAFIPRGSPAPEGRYVTGLALPPASRSRGDYYEDIDLRFAEPSGATSSTNVVPSALLPGPPGETKPSTSQDTPQDCPRSPAISETSFFTSISERPVNPLWRPPAVSHVLQQRRQDVLFASNPDFELPARRGNESGRGNNHILPIQTFQRGGRYPAGA
jgi:hypothetical protein